LQVKSIKQNNLESNIRNQHLRTWEIGINFGMTTSLYQIKARIKLHYVVMFVFIH
jgi:hypothetical protein